MCSLGVGWLIGYCFAVQIHYHTVVYEQNIHVCATDNYFTKENSSTFSLINTM